jgi:hypothetical protein
MSGIKACIRCGRNIDANARLCPYCNWDQTQPVPAVHDEASAAPAYVPPPERRWRKPVGMAVGIVVVLLVATLVLAERLRDTGPQAAPPTEQQQEQMKLQQKEAEAAAQGKVKPSQRANVTLVPDNSPAPPIGEAPVTSAPAPTATTTDAMANAYQRTDATAASSAEYSNIEQRAKAEKKKMDVLVDPRSLSGVAYDQGTMPTHPPKPRTPEPGNAPTAAAARQPVQQTTRTAPVPEYQPVPELRVERNSTARLELTVGADGLVKSVNVKEPIAADMGRLISSIQSWRFKPATENGVPVPSSFTVELSFHGSE